MNENKQDAGGLVCALCHGTLEFLTNPAEPWSAAAYSPCPYCHPASKRQEVSGLPEIPEALDEAIRNVADWANADGETVGPETTHAMEVLRGHIRAYGEQCRAASGVPPFLTDSSGRLHSGEDIELLCQALERIADGALEFEADEGCVRTAAGLLRALSRGVPEGMALVPVEPTPEMETAHRMYGDTSDWWQSVISAAIAASQGQEGGK